MDEEMQRIIAEAVEFALRKDRDQRDHQTKQATEAAVKVALEHQASSIRPHRKPDLPNLDKKHIDAWIKRVEHAYVRADISKPKDKFSFLESKFSGCEDATINAFLEKDTADEWNKFLNYLRDIYGKSKQQRVYTIFNGVPREGRRPNQLAAHIKDLIGKITLDDVLKELLLKEIPPEVRQHAATSIDTLDFEQTAAHLDIYFDKQGKVKNSSHASSINHVADSSQQPRRSRPRQSAMKQEGTAQAPSIPSTTPSEQQAFTPTFEDVEDASDVNAVRFRSDGQKQTFNVSNRAQPRGRSRVNSSGNSSSVNGNSSGRFNSQSRSTNRYSTNGGRFNNGNSSRPPSTNSSKLCSFHEQYGDKARSCREYCSRYAQHQVKGQASN